MDNNFNKLEKAVLNWIMSSYNITELSEQIESATFINRESSGVGFFIQLGTNNKLKPVASSKIFDGPLIRSTGIDCDGGSILFMKNGYLGFLELYANGSFFKEDLTDFNFINPA
jgi:hypothetical protein